MPREHKPHRRMLIASIASVAALLLAAMPATVQAQDYPSQPITFVVPFGPGASNDTFTRTLADLLTKSLGQPVIVENREGAGGFTGSDFVSRSKPDGYTLLESPTGIATMKPARNLDLDPTTDLTPIAMLAASPQTLVVPSSLGVNTVAEFIAYAKANPDTTFYGNTGVGTPQQMYAEMLNDIAGTTIKPVVYPSLANALLDLSAGRLHMVITTIASAAGQIDSGDLKLLAYADDNYPPGSPEAPTFAEEGFDGMQEAQSWWGIYGPPNMPADIVNFLNAKINEALVDEAFVELMARSGAVAMPVTPEEFRQLQIDTMTLAADIAERTGVTTN
jgi:tripartite-type tricarboxylate transporter receptor subunit TctC